MTGSIRCREDLRVESSTYRSEPRWSIPERSETRIHYRWPLFHSPFFTMTLCSVAAVNQWRKHAMQLRERKRDGASKKKWGRKKGPATFLTDFSREYLTVVTVGVTFPRVMFWGATYYYTRVVLG